MAATSWVGCSHATASPYPLKSRKNHNRRAMPLHKVILAKPRGFCAGVVRAIEVVEQSLARFPGPVYVRKEIVHNPHVVNALRQKGAVFVDERSEERRVGEEGRSR